jgi:hypothetical protein
VNRSAGNLRSDAGGTGIHYASGHRPERAVLHSTETIMARKNPFPAIRPLWGTYTPDSTPVRSIPTSANRSPDLFDITRDEDRFSLGQARVRECLAFLAGAGSELS